MRSTEERRIQLFVPPSFEGVSSVVAVEAMLVGEENIELVVNYQTSLDFRDVEQFKGFEMNLILGLTFKGYELPEHFFTEVDVPFADFIHYSTFGEEIEGNHIISQVIEDQDPLRGLYSLLSTGDGNTLLERHLTLTDDVNFVVEAVNAYRIWDWEANTGTKILLALYHAGHKNLPQMVKGLSLVEIVRKYSVVIKGQQEKMKEYIETKASSVKPQEVSIQGQVCTLITLFSEQYVNELADYLLKQYTDINRPTVVCVGRPTRGSDLFSIRTSKVSASLVAHYINEGKGKDYAATVFTGVNYADLMGNSIIQQLTKNQSEG